VLVQRAHAVVVDGDEPARVQERERQVVASIRRERRQ
jgi:hypothetical protein